MFRPCIDLHEGKVKQIVGGTLSNDPAAVRTNFVSERPASWYAELYKRDGLKGGHVIMLGPGNEQPAREALAAYPGGLQIGGGVNAENAHAWLNAGASHVIVLSIPDWSVTPFAEGRDRRQIAAEIDAFNAINREETSRSGARYVDITPVSRRAPELVAGDGLHPSGMMYEEWAQLALPSALAALGR